MRDPQIQSELLGEGDTTVDTHQVLANISDICQALQAPLTKEGKTLLQALTHRVELAEDHLRASIDLGSVLGLNLATGAKHKQIEISAAIKLARRGVELKLVLKGASGEDRTPDPNLI